jgi:hypothetical protein
MAPLAQLLRFDGEFEWKSFERFCLQLAKALPEVRDAHLHGVPGDHQDGIDIHVDLVDGRVRTIQCRHVAEFAKADALAAIAATSYEADEHQVWMTCKVTKATREAFGSVAGWEARDIEQISSAVRGLPREIARWLVEDHLGQPERRRFLGPSGELTIAPARAWFARGDANPRVMGTSQPLEGRQDELAALRNAIVDPSIACVVLVGRGGIGTTRLLRAIADELPERRMLILREGVDVSGAIGEELPMASFDLIIDDAHRRPDLESVLAVAFTCPELDTVILSVPPHALEVVRTQLHNLGLSLPGISVVGPLPPLPLAAAQRLAEHELGNAGQPFANRLGELLRDAPAMLVIAASLIRDGEVAPEALVASPTIHREVLTRYRDERLGAVAGDGAASNIASRLLALIAAVQPVDSTATLIRTWLSAQLGESEADVSSTITVLAEADLLVGAPHRCRVAPGVLADQLLRQQCVQVDGHPTGRPQELVEAVPVELLPQLMVNLAALDWRLRRAGAPAIMDDACAALTRRLLDADAWRRARHLEQLIGSAALLAEWVVRLARDLLDHPAADAELFGDHVITDAEPRRELVKMLGQAGLEPSQTEAAIRLLWEIGSDAEDEPSRGQDPLSEARKLGGYRRPPAYAATLLSVAKQLLADPAQAETRRRLPLDLLSGLIVREGTTSEIESRFTIRLGSYGVSAVATAGFRGQVRELLLEQCLGGGERVRPAAAELLGAMLRQPHGFYGQTIPSEQLKQWRPEQFALLGDIAEVMTRSDDPLVARQLRDMVQWHAERSALHGIKTAARRVLAANPPTVPERLADAVTLGLAGLVRPGALRRQLSNLVRELRATSTSIMPVLEKIDAMIEELRRRRPAEHVDVGPLLSVFTPDEALEACDLLIKDPERPSASGVGLLLSGALASRPAATRELVRGLATSRDAALRRLAADHIARMAWFTEADAPERDLVLDLAYDDDPVVVHCALTVAHRCGEDDPKLAASILLAVRDLRLPGHAETACLALNPAISFTDAEWQSLLDRLLACPQVGHFYDRTIGQRASASWRQVLEHLLARIDERSDDYAYHALPFEGPSEDIFKGHEAERRAGLQMILDRLATDISGRRSYDLPLLFWSAAGNGRKALNVVGAALAAGVSSRIAAELIIASAGRTLLLRNPAWISTHLDRSPAGRPLDDLRGALSGALHSGMKQGTPGEPFPEDVELERKAREHAAKSRSGSRARAFWTETAADVARDIRRQTAEEPD